MRVIARITLWLIAGMILLMHVPPNVTAQDAGIVQADGTLRRIHVPVLMYHYVSPLPPDADIYRIDLTIEPEFFISHLDYLRSEGYTTISLYDLNDALMTGRELPEKPIILTFDDGYIDHYNYVFPMLTTYGFTGTFFVITGKADAGDPAYLSWAQIQEMADAGMNMEPHTRSHLDLRERDYDFLVYEVLGSLQSVEGHTQRPAHMFAYPAGRYDEMTLQVMEQVPVWRSVTTEYGAYHTTDNTLEVSRLRVSGNLGVAGLDQMLRSSR